MTLRRRIARDESAAATLELALLLPILLLILTAVVPLVKGGWEYIVVTRAASHGIRYATRTDVNVRVGPDGTLTRRPTAGEVEDFVRDAAEPLELATVTVDPDPVDAYPGELVRVRTTYQMGFGPLAAAANGVKTLFFGGGPLLPDTTVVTVTATGREE